MAREKICGIYMLTIKTDGFRSYYYVGQSQDCKHRFTNHKSLLKKEIHSNTKLQNVYLKYKNMSFEILEVCSLEDINKYEQWWIDEMHGYKYCMNISKNAEAPNRGLKASEETKIKLKDIYARRTPEEKARIAQSKREKMLGRVFSEESKEKMSKATSGSGNSQFGKKKTEDQKLKVSKSLKASLDKRKAEGNPRPGRIWTDEQKLKVSASLKRAVQEGRRGNNKNDRKKSSNINI